MKHEQKLITYGDHSDEVDAGISDLIIELWKADIGTWMSCQDNVPKNYVWISFNGNDSVFKFHKILAEKLEYDSKQLRKIEGLNNIEKAWKWNPTYNPYSGNVRMSVRFPIEDYNFVLDAITDYNVKNEPKQDDSKTDMLVEFFSTFK